MPSPTFQVFVSSTWEDLQPECKAVREAVQRLRETKVIGMEYFGSREETPEHASLAEVDRSHLYIGIIGGRYGSGITEKEYRRAREKGLPCRIYFKAEKSITLDKAEKNQKQRDLLDKLKKELLRAHTVKEFTSPEQLATEVTADLHDWLNEARPTKAPAAVPTFNALHQLPSPPRDFTGRQEELDELTRALERGGVTISGLQGLGGVGKTTLALKLAQQLKPHYPDAQLYLDLKGTSKTPLSAADAMAHVIRSYKPTAVLPKDEAELGSHYRATLHGQRALLLMDNAANRNQVEPLIPPETCIMLVTSRRHFVLPGLFPRKLDTMSAEDARALLLKISPRINARADEIAKLCGCLPLALRLVASALAERANIEVADYMQRLRSEKAKLSLIDASLSLSYNLLAPKTQELWRALAIFPNTFAAAAAAAVWKMKHGAAQDALGELVNYNLLEWDAATARYRLHDLVRVFADDRLSPGERDKGERRHSSYYLSVLERAHELYLKGDKAFKRGLVLFDLEWPNIQAGHRWAEEHAGQDGAADSLCSNYPTAGSNLFDLRQGPRERIRWREAALAAALRLKSREQEGWHLGSLGIAYNQLGKVADAVKFHVDHLIITCETGDLRGEAIALNNLGAAYTILGKMRRAIKLHEHALLIFRKVGDRRGESQALGHLGSAHFRLKEMRSAMKFYQLFRDMARDIGDHRGEGQALNNLGAVYAALGKVDRATGIYKQRLSMAREIGDRRGEATVLWNISRARYKLGQRNEALADAGKALEIFKQLEHPSAAWVRLQVAEWRKQEKARKA